jgi:tetratricopeptide (TPR) repeat protein
MSRRKKLSEKATGRFRRLNLLALMLLSPSIVYAAVPNADALKQKADGLAFLRNWVQARPLYLKAAAQYRQSGDATDALYCEVSAYRGELPRLPLADYSRQMSRYLALPMVEHDPALRMRVYALKGDGDMDMEAGLALDDWAHVAEIAKERRDPVWINRASGELGLVDLLQGHTKEGTERIGQTIRTAQQQQDWSTVSRFLTIAGMGLWEVHRYQQALPLLDQAIALHQQVPGLFLNLLTYSAKARTLASMDRMSEARETVRQGLALAEKFHSYGYQAELLLIQSQLDAKGRNFGTANADLKQARTLALTGEAWRIAAEADRLSAKMSLAQGDVSRAAHDMDSSLAELRKAGDRFTLPIYLSDAADIDIRAHRLNKANLRLEEAMRLSQGLLLHSSAGEQEIAVLEAMSDIYRNAFALDAYDLHDLEHAFEAVEQARGRAIRDLLLTRPAVTSATQQQELVDLQVSLVHARTSAEQERLVNKIALMAVRSWGNTIPAGVEEVLRSKSATLSQTRQLLRQDEALVEYVSGDRPSALVITREGTNLFPLQEGTLPKELFAEASRTSLFNAYLGPMFRILTAKRSWIIVRDDHVAGIPFDTLMDPSGQPVVRSHTVSFLPAATWLLMHRTLRGRKMGHGLLGVGSLEEGSDASTDWAAAEIKGAATLIPGKSTLLLGKNATLKSYAAAPPQAFAVLHFATHGFADEKYPSHSGLMLDSGNALLAENIAHEPLRAALVNLAACSTDRGRATLGEGSDTLADAFLAGGASSVVGTLRDVDDAFTLGLMHEFYKRLAAGRTVADALREAKLAMIGTYGSAATPENWGVFILLGDGDTRLVTRQEP